MHEITDRTPEEFLAAFNAEADENVEAEVDCAETFLNCFRTFSPESTKFSPLETHHLETILSALAASPALRVEWDKDVAFYRIVF